MKPRAILFDLDNTLWDFGLSSRKSLDEVYSKYLMARGVDKALWLRYYRQHNDCLWAEYRQGMQSSGVVKTERFARSFAEVGIYLTPCEANKISFFFLEKIVENTELFPGVLATLESLESKYTLGVISNGFAVSAERLKSLGMLHFFAVVVTSEEAGKPKPHPVIFKHALQMLALQPEQAVYVGDDYESDILGASNVGMKTVMFSPLGDPPPETSPKPDYFITDFVELKQIFLW